MKLISSSTARRRTANAAWRSFGGPQMPAPVRRIAPNASRCTEISPPSETSPATPAESSFLLMIDLENSCFTLPNADRHRFSSFAGRRSHEFRPDWIANIFAKNGVNSGEVAFSQRPADYPPDRSEVFRATRTPQRHSNTWLLQQPAHSSLNYTPTTLF